MYVPYIGKWSDIEKHIPLEKLTERVASKDTFSWSTVFRTTGYSVYYTTDRERLFTILNIDKVGNIKVERNNDTSSSLSNTNPKTTTGLNPESVNYFRVLGSKDTLVGTLFKN